MSLMIRLCDKQYLLHVVFIVLFIFQLVPYMHNGYYNYHSREVDHRFGHYSDHHLFLALDQFQ